MIVYKDRSYCSQMECANSMCHRWLAPEDRKRAAEVRLPLALANYRTNECGFVKSPEEPR